MRCLKESFKAGSCFHLYNHAIGNEKLFRGPDDYLLLLRSLKVFLKKYNVTVFAYCLMPNHFHFLLRQDDEKPAYKLINTLFSSYVQIFNKQNNRKGRLLRSPLNHVQVDNDLYFIYLCQYIHYNPVKAGLVSRAEDWPYSNYREWIGMRNGSLFHPQMRDKYFDSSEEYRAGIDEHEKYLEDLPFMRLTFRITDKQMEKRVKQKAEVL